MSDEFESRVIEAMARAMATADGEDPDRDMGWATGDFLWKRYEHLALKQYRAYLAMQSVLMDQRPKDAPGQAEAQDAQKRTQGSLLPS